MKDTRHKNATVYVIPLISNAQNEQIHPTESRVAIVRGRREGTGEWLLVSVRSFGRDEDVPELTVIVTA